MTMLSVVSVHAAATVGALSWFKSESSFPIFWLAPAFKKQFQISRFFPRKVILPQQPQLPTTLERLWPNMVPTAPFPQLRGDVSWRQVQQLKNKQEDTLKTNEERQEAHSPCPQLRHVFNHSLFDVLVYHRKQARNLPSA